MNEQVTRFRATQISLGRTKDPARRAGPEPIKDQVILRVEEYGDQISLWSQANATLRRWAQSCQLDEIAEFVISYEDGEKYDGSLQLTPPETEEQEWLEYHIQAFHRSMREDAEKGSARPHFKEAVDELTRFLSTHQIGASA